MRTTSLEVRITASPSGICRIGFVVAKHGGGSVDRNRLKRRLRELARTRLLGRLAPVDLVIRTLPGARELAWGALLEEFATLEGKVLRTYPQVNAP
jgi:ribonuclease P protein component